MTAWPRSFVIAAAAALVAIIGLIATVAFLMGRSASSQPTAVASNDDMVGDDGTQPDAGAMDVQAYSELICDEVPDYSQLHEFQNNVNAAVEIYALDPEGLLRAIDEECGPEVDDLANSTQEEWADAPPGAGQNAEDPGGGAVDDGLAEPGRTQGEKEELFAETVRSMTSLAETDWPDDRVANLGYEACRHMDELSPRSVNDLSYAISRDIAGTTKFYGEDPEEIGVMYQAAALALCQEWASIFGYTEVD